MNKRRICVVLTTRGNYAKMKSVIGAIESHPNLELQLILGGMVLLQKYGRVIDEFGGSNLKVDRRIHFVVEGGTPETMTKSAGIAVSEFATAFQDLKPDIVIVIADRFECLPIAMAAAYMNITVAHVEGGEVSGSIDESIRHAITKLSHIHFPASREAAERICRMGEDAASIHMVGGTSMDIIRRENLDDLNPVIDCQNNYGVGAILDLKPREYLVLIQHPVTTEYDKNQFHIEETIAALDKLHMPTVWIMPNMDAGADGINKGIRRFRETMRPDYIHFFKSLPIELYAPLMKHAACIMGNSSSGIRESAFLGTPGVNIGTRQLGRERGHNVIDVANDRVAIVEAVRYQIAQVRYEPDYRYGDGFAAEKIVNVLKDCPLNIQKQIAY